MSNWERTFSDLQQYHSVVPEVAPVVLHTINSIAVEAPYVVPIAIQTLHCSAMPQYQVLIPVQQNLFESVHLQNSVTLQPCGMSNLLLEEHYHTNGNINTIQNHAPLNQVQINTCVDQHIAEPLNQVKINTFVDQHIAEPLNQVQINTFVDQHIAEPLNQVQINTCVDQHVTNQYSENINTTEHYDSVTQMLVHTCIPQHNQNPNSVYMNTIEDYELLNQFQVNTCIAQHMENQNSGNVNRVNNDEVLSQTQVDISIAKHTENESSENCSNIEYYLPDNMPTVTTVQSINEKLQEMSSKQCESENSKLDEQNISQPFFIINTSEQDCFSTTDKDRTSEKVVAPEKHIITVSQSNNIVLLVETQEKQNSDIKITDTVIGSEYSNTIVNTSEVELREKDFTRTNISDNVNISQNDTVPTAGILKSVQSIDSVLPVKDVCSKKEEHNDLITKKESELNRVCLVCGKYCKDSYTLKLHLACHSSQHPFQCDICTRSFKLQGSLDFHKRKHSDKYYFLCEYCSFFTSIKAKLLKHEKQQHSSECVFQCKICDNIFKKKDFPNHILMHTDNTILIQCEKCDKVYKEYRHFYSHMKTHDLNYVKKVRELCFICDKTVKNLERHRREHMTVAENEEYKCDTCNKCITTRDGMIKHLRLHTGGKTYL